MKHRDGSRLIDMTTAELDQRIETTMKRVINDHLPDPDPGLQVLSTTEAAKLLGTNRGTLYGWVERGLIDCFYVGNRKRFTMAEVQKFIDRGGTNQQNRRTTSRNARHHKG